MDAITDLSLSNSLADLAARIRDEHEQVKAASQRGLAHAVAAGAMLTEAKAKVGHGDWLDWLRDQCGITIRTAQAYMRAAREMPKLDPAKAQRVAHLSFRQAMVLMANGTRVADRHQAIIAAAEAEPEKYGRYLDNVERTGRVDAPFKRLTVMRQAEAIRAEPPPLPAGRYRVASIDVPWTHPFRTDNAPPYPVMTLDQIKALPIARLLEDNGHVWMWATNYHLGEGLAKEVLDAWGLAPKAILTWFKTDLEKEKDPLGTGSWLRNVTEHCLFAARGNPVHTLTNQTTALFAPAGAHSEKPDEFYALVEQLCPAPPGGYLEMFARKARPGWVTWGDEVPKAEAAE